MMTISLLTMGSSPLQDTVTPTPNADISSSSATVDSTTEIRFYENNPILTIGNQGQWDSQAIIAGAVTFYEDVYHMFYSGLGDQTPHGSFSIGHATSQNGLTWEKDINNPILTVPEANIPIPDISRVALPEGPNMGLFASCAIVENDIWTLYITQYIADFQNRSLARRMTAPSPIGPWTIDDNELLTAESIRQWDAQQLFHPCAVRTENGYNLYYGAGLDSPGLGLATSNDSLSWSYYDDSATTERKYAISDPILTYHGEIDGYLFGISHPIVLATSDGWSMFYRTRDWVPEEPVVYKIKYATSTDGISWKNYEDNPLWEALHYKNRGPGVTDNSWFAEYFSVFQSETTFMIYSHFSNDSDTDLSTINLGFWNPAE